MPVKSSEINISNIIFGNYTFPQIYLDIYGQNNEGC